MSTVGAGASNERTAGTIVVIAQLALIRSVAPTERKLDVVARICILDDSTVGSSRVLIAASLAPRDTSTASTATGLGLLGKGWSCMELKNAITEVVNSRLWFPKALSGVWTCAKPVVSARAV